MKQLKNDNITKEIKELRNKLANKNKNNKRYEVTRISLLIEETLLKYKDKFGDEIHFEINIKKRFFNDYVEVLVKAPRFDCRDTESDKDILQRIIGTDSQIFSWSYKKECNVITILPEVEKQVPNIVWVALALVLSVVAYWICQQLPAGVNKVISETLIPEMNNIMYDILRMIAGLLIAFSIMSSIIHIGNLDTLKTTLKKIVKRSFINSLGISLVFVAILLFFVSDVATGNKINLSSIFELLLGMVPRNIFTPFIDGNMMQITVLSLLIGMVLIVVGRANGVVLELIETAEQAIIFSMQVFCKYLPLLVFLNIFSVIPSFKSVSFSDISIPFILCIAAILLIMIIQTAEMSLFHKIKPSKLLKATMPGVLVTLTTASSAAAITPMKNGLKKIGLDKNFIDLSLPLVMVFYKPTAVVTTFTGVLAVSLALNYPMSVGTVVMVCILALIINYAFPLVPGGMLSCLTILNAELAFPVGSMGLLILVAIILDYIAGAFHMYCLQLEVAGIGYRQGALAKD